MSMSPTKAPVTDENAFSIEDFFDTDLTELDENSGFDILQGFEKIGNVSHVNQPARQPTKGSHKPALGRSYTSTF